MTDAPVRQSTVSSISLPREMAEWVDTQAKLRSIPKSKLIQLALIDFREKGPALSKDTAGV